MPVPKPIASGRFGATLLPVCLLCSSFLDRLAAHIAGSRPRLAATNPHLVGSRPSGTWKEARLVRQSQVDNMIGFVACAPTISKQKVIENSECGRWRPFNRIGVILRPNTNQCVVPIAWGKVELNSRRFCGHLVGAKAHDLG